MKKYICIGGYVTSKNDGERHYISPHKLTELYRVDKGECFLCKDDSDPLLLGIRTEDLIELRPRYDGNYLTTPNR